MKFIQQKKYLMMLIYVISTMKVFFVAIKNSGILLRKKKTPSKEAGLEFWKLSKQVNNPSSSRNPMGSRQKSCVTLW